MAGIILFDGVCNFCNGSVQFIIKRDDVAYFQFASLQSDVGKMLLEKHDVPKNINSLVLIEEDHYSVKSTAALKICRRLSGLWPILTVFLMVPTRLRDVFYDLIARNRYKWFGKQESCFIPSPDIKKRFLDH